MLTFGDLVTHCSYILPVGGRGSPKNRRITSINSWHCRWCRHEGFGFHDNGIFFSDYNLLERDGTHLSRRGKGIFGNRLANLVCRALNSRAQGVEGKVTMLKPSHLAGD